MARFSSKNDICQAAAFKIGTEPITDVDNPQTVMEKRLGFLYDKVRRYVLRLGVWNFAQQIKTIANLKEEVPEGFAMVFEFPNDFVRFEGFVVDGEYIVPDTSSYMIANSKIYLRGPNYAVQKDNVSLLTIKYIKDFEEVRRFDDCFLDAFILRLAYELAYMTTTKTTLTNRLNEEFWESITQARMIDGQEQKPRVVSRSKWVQARRAGSYSSVALPYREGM